MRNNTSPKHIYYLLPIAAISFLIWSLYDYKKSSSAIVAAAPPASSPVISDQRKERELLRSDYENKKSERDLKNEIIKKRSSLAELFTRISNLKATLEKANDPLKELSDLAEEISNAEPQNKELLIGMTVGNLMSSGTLEEKTRWLSGNIDLIDAAFGGVDSTDKKKVPQEFYERLYGDYSRAGKREELLEDLKFIEPKPARERMEKELYPWLAVARNTPQILAEITDPALQRQASETAIYNLTTLSMDRMGALTFYSDPSLPDLHETNGSTLKSVLDPEWCRTNVADIGALIGAMPGGTKKQNLIAQVTASIKDEPDTIVRLKQIIESQH